MDFSDEGQTLNWQTALTLDVDEEKHSFIQVC